MVQATYLTQAWYEIYVVPILPPVFLTHCFLSSRYVNSTTNQSPNAAPSTSDDTNCGLGRAKGARIKTKLLITDSLKNKKQRGLRQGERAKKMYGLRSTFQVASGRKTLRFFIVTLASSGDIWNLDSQKEEHSPPQANHLCCCDL